MRRTILFTVTVFVLTKVSTGNIKLVNNGYENVNIFIGDRVTEDQNLIDDIKEAFTDASALLFKATKNRAYFKNITIVIPKGWKQIVNSTLTSVGTLGEHIRIDRKNRVKGDAPYVRGNLECGKPGWFMHLTPDFFLKYLEDTPYGPKANGIVHEWGHLRWGLFDEYPSIQHPGTTKPDQKIQFYTSKGQWRPATCSSDIKGGAYRQNCNAKKSCNLKSIKIQSQCKFCPNRQQTAKASLMSLQWIQSMDSFCDKDTPSTDPAVRHNSKSPNNQNYFCNGQSAWEVMRKHPDFKNGNNKAAANDTVTIPTFSIVKATGRIRVLVLDVSGSMQGSRITQQQQASEVVIENVIEKKSWLGIVSFDSTARTLVALTQIKGGKNRSYMKQKVPNYASGGTEIIAGLKRAIEVIESKFPTEGTEIILLSDGESNNPYLQIVPKLQQKGIIVHTISISQQADVDMTKLAAVTGGKSYTYLETNSVSFVDVLSQAISAGTTDRESIEKVFGSKTFINSTSPLVDHFTIDDGLGNTTTLTIIQSNSNSITINITRPDGYMYTNTSSERILLINFDDNVQVGRYNFTITTTENSKAEIEVTVTTHPVSNEAEVIRVTSTFSNSTLDFNNPVEMRVYTSVMKGLTPVLNANVIAILSGDSTYTARDLYMKDNGKGADLIANDGIYSVYILKSYFTSNNRYNVKVSVTGDGGTFTYTAGVSGDSEAASIPGAVNETGFIAVQLDEFQRESVPGEITVLNSVNNNKDITPPAKISDLWIDTITKSNNTVHQTLAYTFVWTAVGNDMDIGTASFYEMRMDLDIDHVRTNFSQATIVPVNLTQPKPSGETERYTVNFSLDDCNGTCYLAVRAVDENGLISEISNIVSVDIDFSYEPEEIYTDDDDNDGVAEVTEAISTEVTEAISTEVTEAISSPSPTMTNTDTTTQGKLSQETIIGIACGASVFLIIAVVLVSYFVFRQRGRKEENRVGFEVKPERASVSFENPSFMQ